MAPLAVPEWLWDAQAGPLGQVMPDRFVVFSVERDSRVVDEVASLVFGQEGI